MATNTELTETLFGLMGYTNTLNHDRAGAWVDALVQVMAILETVDTNQGTRLTA
jgi:hypothetical protein